MSERLALLLDEIGDDISLPLRRIALAAKADIDELARALVAMDAHPLKWRRTLAEVEREHIERVIRETATPREASAVLGMSPATIYRRLKQYREVR